MPFGVVFAVVTVNVELPEVLMELGLNFAVAPGMLETPSDARVTVPVKFSGVTIAVNVAVLPAETVTYPVNAFIVNQKSGVSTATVHCASFARDLNVE